MRAFITAAALLAVSSIPAAAESPSLEIGEGARAALAILPGDHPEGHNATVKLVALERVANLHDAVISTFIIDYRPGGSAVLHRHPSPGYLLIYILSGSIRAQAWSAGVGVYRAGEIWVEPAFADNIVSNNASATEPARALVITVAREMEELEAE